MQDQRFSQALDFLKAQKDQEAEPLLLSVIVDHPSHADAHFYLGLIATAQNRFNEAIIFYQATLNLGVDAYTEDCVTYYLGEAYLKLGKANQALPFLEKAVLKKPEDYRRHFYFGQALSWLKQYDRALEHLQIAENMDPSDKVRYLISECLIGLDCFEEALTLCEEKCLNDPGNPDAYHNYAICHFQLKNFEKAAEICEAAIINCRQSPLHNIYNLYGHVLREQENMVEAEEYFSFAMALRPENIGFSLDFANLLIDIQEYERAIICANRVYSTTEGKNIDAISVLLRVMCCADQFEAIEKRFFETFHTNPDQYAYYALHELYRASGDLHQSEDFLSQSIAIAKKCESAELELLEKKMQEFLEEKSAYQAFNDYAGMDGNDQGEFGLGGNWWDNDPKPEWN